MRIRWFGRTWEAPICEDGYQVDPPVGEICLSCREWIYANDRGVVMAASPNIEGSFPLTLQHEHGYIYEARVCAYHIDCFLESVLPGPAGVTRM